jgi:hypothetical protein
MTELDHPFQAVFEAAVVGRVALALPMILPPDFRRAVTQLPPRLGHESIHVAFSQGDSFPVLLA